MAEPMNTSLNREPFDFDLFQSQITDLRSKLTISDSTGFDSENLLQDFVVEFEKKVEQILADQSDVGTLNDEDLDAYSGHLREELRMTEDESTGKCNEIEALRKTYIEGTFKLESNVEGLNCMLDYAKSRSLGKANEGASVGYFEPEEGHPVFPVSYHDNNFQILKLNHQIEERKAYLKSLQDLHSAFKRFGAIEKIEEAFACLKVIGLEGNCIRLLLKTFIPDIEGLTHLKLDDIKELSEINHELLVEVMDATFDLKHAEIFPNDVFIADIVEAATSFRLVSSTSSLLEIRSSFEWFLHKVQYRIVMCSLRRYVVKNAAMSRHSLEYLDRDELIVVHMAGGIEVFIKISQDWPMLNSALKLVSLKSSGQNAKDISLSLLCKVEEAANSLDDSVRKNIKDFVDAIEEIIVEKMRHELHLDHSSN